MGTQCGIDMVKQGNITGSKQRFTFRQNTVTLQYFFNVDLTPFSQVNLTGFFINGVIAVAFLPFFVFFFLLYQFRDHCINCSVQVRAVLGCTGNNKRRSCLIDKNRVNLIHYRVVQRALNAILRAEGHIVTEVIETEFVVCSVSNVCVVSLTLHIR